MATTPDPMASITIVKRFTYRGDSTEEFENTYHFAEVEPPTSARWKALADAIIASEKSIYTLASGVTIVRAFGHGRANKVAKWFYDYLANSASVGGTLSTPSGAYQPGDVAAWIKWSTDTVNERGKPIWLRNYYHGVYDNGATVGTQTDSLASTQKTAMQNYGNAWIAGFSDGTATYHRAGPRGAVGLAATPSTYLTTRSLKKRGKRRVV